MIKEKIILIGGGGHCKSSIEAIESASKFEILGIIDEPSKIGKKILGYTIIGTDDDLPELSKTVDYAIVTVGQIRSAKVRISIYDNLKSLGFKLPIIIASTAHVSKHSQIGEGTIVFHHAMVNSGSVIGNNCIINSKALIEHDCSIGDHCHISTNVVLNGDVTIGNECFVGSCSTFVNGITITNNVFLGINTIVNKSIKEPGMYVGTPFRKIK